jgi:hypothetical protein
MAAWLLGLGSGGRGVDPAPAYQVRSPTQASIAPGDDADRARGRLAGCAAVVAPAHLEARLTERRATLRRRPARLKVPAAA